MTTKHFHDKPLYVGTKDLHHACEEHEVGAAMSRGDISDQWWADWLGALQLIHMEIDYEVPRKARRTNQLIADIENSRVRPRANQAALKLGRDLGFSRRLREAAYYVVTGAHLMGGQVMRKTLKGKVPDSHLYIGDREALVADWSPMRDRSDLVAEARSIFAALLDIMDEIVKRDGE